MNTEVLSRMIEDLILDNESIFVPGLGTFGAKLVPASFSDRGYTINPPYRRLSFTLAGPGSFDDGILTARYSSITGIAAAQSKANLLKFSESIILNLKARGEVELPGLGVLKSTPDGLCVFVQNEDVEIFPSGLGLESISLRNNKAVTLPPVEVSPVPIPASTPEPAPAPAAATPPATSAKKPSGTSTEAPARPSVNPGRVILAILFTILATALLAYAALMALSAWAPEVLDQMLYNEEQLELIRRYGL